jgi:hypothetical protein
VGLPVISEVTPSANDTKVDSTKFGSEVRRVDRGGNPLLAPEGNSSENNPPQDPGDDLLRVPRNAGDSWSLIDIFAQR